MAHGWAVALPEHRQGRNASVAGRQLPIIACALFTCLAGCGSPQSRPRSNLDQEMFGPASIRLHPTFTQVRNWTGGTRPDGIEATLEVDDQFGDPTRSTGEVTFELYSYRKDSPEIRGRRLIFWRAALNNREQQQAHWNSALRAYTFQLHYPQISTEQYYVLTAQLDLNSRSAESQPAGGPATSRPAGRLFSRLILEPQTEGKHLDHQRAPAPTPGH